MGDMENGNILYGLGFNVLRISFKFFLLIELFFRVVIFKFFM